MRIKNAKVFVGMSFVDTDIEFDHTITALGPLNGPAELDAQGCYVIPGLVDIHTHGAVGEDFSDGKPSRAAAPGRLLRRPRGHLLSGHHHDSEGGYPHPRAACHPGLPPTRRGQMRRSTPGGSLPLLCQAGPRRRRKTFTSRTFLCFTASTKPAEDR